MVMQIKIFLGYSLIQNKRKLKGSKKFSYNSTNPTEMNVYENK